ncbi:hypothetical protein P0Y35_06365 [Kiritimatiellaeota bacterium B1221]|nr:hypothetical protein [Kiritimatiellaeota bacterium B1221]
MKPSFKIILFSAGISLLLFCSFTWPLPSLWNQGIPSSSQNIEHPAWRHSIPGDHLQLLYHFDLVEDMFKGRIPFFQNVYEFNTGNDAERYRPGAYFFPMSGVYVLLKQFMGQPAAWNSTLWLSFWMSGLACWAWLGCFTPHRPARLAGVCLFLLIPFRWASLLGGSPAGIALMWVPLLGWMIDRAVTRPGFLRGLGAGLTLLFLYWADLQTFYFSALSVPLLALLSLCWHGQTLKDQWKSWWKLLPGGGLFLGIIATFYLWRKAHLSASHMEEGRQWAEMALFSPRPEDVLHVGSGISETVYIGWIAFVWLILAFLLFIYPARKQPLRLSAYLMLILASFIGIALALGAFGPADALFIRMARAQIPSYDMIRQPSKIFSVIPLWLGWLLTLGLASPLPKKIRAWKLPVLLPLLATFSIIFSFHARIHPTISLLEARQPAYTAVQSHAAENHIDKPLALVIPLWPGDSAESSVPIHYAHQHQLRLVNGYSPVVSKEYTETAVKTLSPLNQGMITEAQLAYLDNIGVDYVLVHANMFPEKVSPFPVRETLVRLDRHPRLKRLTQSGPIHAYAVRPPEQEDGLSVWSPEPAILFPARRWELAPPGGEPLEDVTASHGAFSRIRAEQNLKIETPPIRISTQDPLTWWIRIKGKGEIESQTLRNGKVTDTQTLYIASKDWKWIAIPQAPASTPSYISVQQSLQVETGVLDFDAAFLSGSTSLLEIPPQGITLPASWFFHAGYADPATESVHFNPDADPDRVVFYGPLLPIQTGTYQINVLYDSPAEAGTPLGEISIGYNGEAAVIRQNLITGGSHNPLPLWENTDEKPLRIEFRYNRQSPVEIRGIQIRPFVIRQAAGSNFQ